jgi:hypothetical protein
VCTGLGEPPVLAKPVIQSMERRSMERARARGGECLAALERERKVTLASLFSGKISDAMATALDETKAMCPNLYPDPENLERIDLERGDLFPVEDPLYEGLEGEELERERKAGGCGCSSCPCDSAVCLSVSLGLEAGVYVIWRSNPRQTR